MNRSKDSSCCQNRKLPGKDDTSCTSVTSKAKTNSFKFPLAVFLEEKRKTMDNQKKRVSQLQTAVIESSFSSAGSTP